MRMRMSFMNSPVGDLAPVQKGSCFMPSAARPSWFWCVSPCDSGSHCSIEPADCSVYGRIDLRGLIVEIDLIACSPHELLRARELFVYLTHVFGKDAAVRVHEHRWR